jgi:hypothetical protein
MVRVMPFGDREVLMSEELLHIPDVNALVEQARGEGVPETVRVGMDAGRARTAACPVANDRLAFTIA